MNGDFFALFDLRPEFNLDVMELESRYLALQQQFHPDRFAGKSGAEKLSAQSRAADINLAYETLKDPLLRANHILRLSGVDFDIARDRTVHDQDILIEMMERREELECAEPAKLAVIGQRLELDIAALLQNLSQLIAEEKWDKCTVAMLRFQYLRKFQDDWRQKRLDSI